ncbi:MAG: hypothetical protein HOF21_09795 [Nitrospina sp.]|nr:hypothetical protein [Nitrospina sp.]
MVLLNTRSYLSVLVLCGFLVAGCGKKPEAEIKIESFDTPPQVTITLHSQLELDYSLEPESQEDDDKEDGQETSKFISDVYAKLKRERRRKTKGKILPAFQADTDYQSIKRYEKIDLQRYAITIKKGPEKPSIRKTVNVQDKPLIFAGRGYNSSAFEKETKPAIDVDYSTHLLVAPPDPSVIEKVDLLDPEEGYSRDSKFLVYSSTRSAFNELPPPLVESIPESLRSVGSTVLPERIPESVLVFQHGKESLLLLRKAEKQFDLLEGNESLNKKQFYNSSLKVPETSSKTPSTLQ